jgi:hypothetical protein
MEGMITMETVIMGMATVKGVVMAGATTARRAERFCGVLTIP